MGAPKRKAMRPKAPGSMARQRGEKPRGQKSCTPSSATGTIGTRRCRERMGAPFLNFFGAPSIERSPSGKRISTLPWRRPNALACMARSRLVSGSTGTRLIFRANQDRKSTRLNSSHSQISYAVFCLKKKKKKISVYQLGRADKQAATVSRGHNEIQMKRRQPQATARRQ